MNEPLIPTVSELGRINGFMRAMDYGTDEEIVAVPKSVRTRESRLVLREVIDLEAKWRKKHGLPA